MRNYHTRELYIYTCICFSKILKISNISTLTLVFIHANLCVNHEEKNYIRLS